ncbi:hypothetical protein OPKNFCMD_0051 [Methylobacterium crusticola]|uniref:Uncharacterized protein n=1 Tax=Methylobacterium crusticola TaxID=1697972 RepID=A0ABQ4QR20_9HYPH|nr:hypothetical protein [Methylobacterium crusticola]GJD47345.1 hypothetical protein OPKNFCMD_0051 [Methylobacterium crusticola]
MRLCLAGLALLADCAAAAAAGPALPPPAPPPPAPPPVNLPTALVGLLREGNNAVGAGVLLTPSPAAPAAASPGAWLLWLRLAGRAPARDSRAERVVVPPHPMRAGRLARQPEPR